MLRKTKDSLSIFQNKAVNEEVISHHVSEISPFLFCFLLLSWFKIGSDNTKSKLKSKNVEKLLWLQVTSLNWREKSKEGNGQEGYYEDATSQVTPKEYLSA